MQQRALMMLILFLLPATWAMQLCAQELPDKTDQAALLFTSMQYARAAVLYEKMVRQRPDADYMSHLGYCYNQMRDCERAEFWYHKLEMANLLNASDRFFYAGALMQNGKYGQALAAFKDCRVGDVRDKNVLEKKILSCEQAAQGHSDSSYTIRPVPELNSGNSEFGLVSLGDRFIFSSDRMPDPARILNPENTRKAFGWTGASYLKLYSTTRNRDGKFTRPLLDRELNTRFHVGPVVLSKDKKRIYFTQTRLVKGPTWFGVTAGTLRGENRLELYYRDFKQGHWSAPKPFPYNNPLEYSTCHPALSADGKVLYFASDRPGGFGGADLYASLITGSTFSAPVNLGPGVNTAGNEVFPYSAPDGSLYFSSDGRIGLGGLDIYRATGLASAHPEVLDPGAPINSARDDFSFSWSDSTATSGYFSSNRLKGGSNDDIYAFTFTDVPPLLQGLPVTAVRPFLDGIELKPIPPGRAFVKFKPFMLILPSAARSVPAVSQEEENELTETEPMTKATLVKGKTFVLKNFYYDLDKWVIRPDAARQLDLLFQVLAANPGVSIELSSHTDSRGSDAYNELLSQLRADAAVRYLSDKGIATTRLQAKGYGERKLVNKCRNDVPCTEAEHQQNRRTEVTVE